MPLSEADAITIRDTFDTLPDEAKPLASDWLKRYKDQQDEFGLPLFPSDSVKAEEEQKAFFSMFDDLKSVDAGNGIYDQAERLKAGDGDRLRMREAGMRFLARQYASVSPDIVRRDYPLYRDDFAMKAGGKRDMGDGEFYSFAKEQVMKQREAQDLRARSLDAGFRAAIQNAGSLEAFAKVAATAGDVDKSEVDPSSFLESYSVATATLNKHRGLVREIMDGVKANMDGGDVDLEPLKERLLDLPGTERRMVLASLRMQAEKAGESASATKGGKYWGSFWQQTGESAFRIAQNAMTSTNDMERAVDAVPETNSPESMFGGGGVQFSGKEIKTAEDARKYVQESIAFTLGTEATIRGAGPQGGALGAMDTRNTIKLDDKAQRLIADAKEREKKRLRVDNEIRTIGEAADPIPNVFASTIGTSGAALLLMAGTRGLAAPALASAYSNIEYNDLSLKYPTMNREDKALIAGLSGAAQSALDFVGVKVLDKLPGIKSLLAQPLTRQLAGRALVRAGGTHLAEFGVESVQDAMTPLLMAALASDVPGYDAKKDLDEFMGGRLDTFVGLLPLTLLGMGAVSVNEYRGAKALLTWNDKLASAGVVEQDRTAIIETAQAGDVEKAQTMLIDAWSRRDPATAAEYQAAMSERQGQQQAAIADLERLGALPTIRRDGDGWTVRQGETVAKFKTWEEARDVATQSMNDAEAAQVELVASLADGFLASTPSFLKGESVEFRPRSESLVDRVSAGALTPESAMEAAIAGGVIKGVSMTEARSIAADVFGGQSKDERAAQFRADVEKIAVLGRNVVTGGESRSVVNAAGNEKAFLTAVEEVVEGRWKSGLERRAFTREQGIRFVQMAEAATGETFLEGATWEELAASKEASPRALTEAISRVIVADVLGRMKDGKRIGPGSMSRGLNLNDREQSAFALILDTFRRLFKALLETAAKLAKARAEGKLGEEYDALFDSLTGGSSQIEHEAGAAKEVESIRDEASDYVDDSQFAGMAGNDTFSTSRATPADASKVVQMPDGARLVGPTTFSIRAFHGTPHKVDKFSLAKIGTGEGAQAYGWGLYFAETPEVAKTYKTSNKKSSGRQQDIKWTIDGTPYVPSSDEETTLLHLKQQGDASGNLELFNNEIEQYRSFSKAPGRLGETMRRAVSFAETLLSSKVGTDLSEGNLYTVELLPDADEFLDWDKPLATQKNPKLDALKKQHRAFLQDPAQRISDKGKNGDSLYHMVTRQKGSEKAASEYLASLGIPGIRYLDGGSRGAGDGTRNYVIFDENLVRILEENGKAVPQETFSLAARDAEYMAAVEAGDMEKAQTMVDEAAKAAGYNVKAFHGGKGGITAFKKKVPSPNLAPQAGPFFAESREMALAYAGRNGVVYNSFLSLGNNPLTIDAKGSYYASIPTPQFLRKAVSAEEVETDLIAQEAFKKGYSSVTFQNLLEGRGGESTVYVTRNPEQIKSADPVTRDESGNVIPLSQRFNPADNRITYSIGAGDFASRMENRFALFEAKPELRLAVAQVAKQRALKLGAEWIEKAAILRTVASIEKEQAFREADGTEQRIQAYLDSLTPSARQELEFEPSALENDPLIAAMLDEGKLMSRSTAVKNGVKNLDEYDGAPWLPPAWYSKGSGITPGKMAKALHDGPMDQGGPLAGNSAQDLWEALASRIASTRKNKEAHRQAVQAYQEAKRAAKADAKAEAEAWASQTKKQAGSAKAQRDALKAALRTLDGILAAAPAVVRARVGGYVKLAGLATDEAMLSEIERRIDKLNRELEKWLKKEALGEIRDLLKKGRPDAEAGKKAKGKDADLHYLFAAAEKAAKLDALGVTAELASLDARILSGELTPEQEVLAMTERGIVELVGDLDNADAGKAYAALEALRDVYEGAWLKWKLAEIERKERRAGMRQEFIEATGKEGLGKQRSEADKEARKWFGIKAKWLSLSSFGEVLNYAFGSGSLTNSLVDSERKASNSYEDANQKLADEVEELFTSIAGGRLAGEKLRWEMSQESIFTDKANLSQLQAIQALLMWRQEDGRRHMEGTRDENSNVTSKWSYDQAWVDEVEKALTPEARRVMGWIMSKYGAEYATLNPLYRLRYGVNLPQHDAYAPITVTPMQTKAGEVVDPVTGAAVSGSGSILTPGSLRTRSRSAIAEPDFRDALQTFLGHSRQLEYWKAYYDLAVEANAILGNRDVMNAVHAKGGKEAASVLRQWIDAIAQGGFRDNSTRLELMRGVGSVVGRASGVALLGRISAVLVQSTQLAAASVQMPVTAYLSRFARLFTGGLNWGEAINSPFIQRRFKTAPPIVRQAMEGLATAKPNAVMGATRALGNLLSGADALFTAGTYAILLDFHRAQGSAAGLTGAELEAYATNEAERGTEQVAQPTRMAGRSLAELISTHPLSRVAWAFASEARQKVALTGWALANAKSDPARAAKAVVLTFLVGGLLSQVLKNALRELKGDDDKNLWSPQRLLYASTIAPLVSAVPLGSVALGDSNTLSSIQRAANSLDDGEIDMRDVDTILSAAGLFSDTAAGLAQLSHLGLDAAKVVQHLSEP